MRHDPLPGVFNGSYINNNVNFNVQDAFLESNISDDGLTRAFTYISIQYNSGAPDPEIVDLERQLRESHHQIKFKYRFIKRAPKNVGDKYERLRKQLKNTNKRLEDEIESANRNDYFFRMQNPTACDAGQKSIENSLYSNYTRILK
jgi:hypothetical protein